VRPRPLEHPGPFDPFDERDTVFARARLVPGTERHRTYYERRPELLEQDEKTRALKNLASPGTRRYRPLEAALVEGEFAASDALAAAVERSGDGSARSTPEGLGVVGEEASDGPRHRLPDRSPPALTASLKEAALFTGADDVGVAPLDPGFVYTHRGRPIEAFGDEVDLHHSHAIVMAFVMRHGFVASGPEMAATAEVARVYAQAATASYALADAARRLGFEARAHVDSNYLVICTALAVRAGLGELGRNGILIHPAFGPGVRLGVVTIDAPLEPDTEGCCGIAEFCRGCGKCATNCPSRSIPEGDPEVVRGALKWPLDPERCYHYWRTAGTDCGICIRSCPFGKRDTPLHRLVRRTIAATTVFNRLFLFADDLFYGARPGPTPPPLLGIGKIDEE
jgi:ferredoxin